MQESVEDFGEQDEDTEIQNLPLYTERKADGIYRYRRRVPKTSWSVSGNDTSNVIWGISRRTSQRRPKASAIRRTTGLGSGCMLKGNGWRRVTQERKGSVSKGAG